MTDTSAPALQWRLMALVMRADFRSTIAEQALRARGVVSTTAKSRLDSAIRRSIKLSGYRNPARAPVELLVDRVAHRCCTEDALTKVLLEVWVETKSDLREAVIEHLSQLGQVVDYQDELCTHLSAWDEDEMQAACDAFLIEHPHEDLDEVCLMLCCLTGRVSLPREVLDAVTDTDRDDPSISEQPPEQSLCGVETFVHALKALSGVPCDDPIWDDADSLTRPLGNLAIEKQAERVVASRRRELDEQLSLLEEVSDSLRFFGVIDVADWQAEACPTGRVDEALSLVSDLLEVVRQYADLGSRPRAERLEDQREIRRQMEETEELVLLLCNNLASLFSSDDVPPEPPDSDPDTSGSSEAGTDEQIENADDASKSRSESVGTQDKEEQASEIGEATQLDILDEDGSTEHAERDVEALQESLTNTREIVEAPLPTLPFEEVTGKACAGELEFERKERENGIQTCSEETQDDSSLEMCSPTTKITTPDQPTRELPVHMPDSPASNLIWDALGSGDYSLGYWISRSAESLGHTPEVSSNLLAMLQGSVWLSPGSNRFVADVRGLSPVLETVTTTPCKLVAAAIILRAALVAPDAVPDWRIVSVPDMEMLNQLMQMVCEFARLGIVPREQELLEGVDSSALMLSLHSVEDRASKWLATAPLRRLGFKRASDVWQALVKEGGGDLWRLLDAVRVNDPQRFDDIHEEWAVWQQSGFVDRKIDKLTADLRLRKDRRLEGPIRQKLVRDIREALETVERWLNLTGLLAEAEQPNDWRRDKLASFLEGLRTALPGVTEELSQLSRRPNVGKPDLVASEISLNSVACLAARLGLSLEDLPTPSRVPPELDYLTEGIYDLGPAISRRLFWFPEVRLDEDANIVEDDIPGLYSLLENPTIRHRSLAQSVDIWMEKQDYRFVEDILAALGADIDIAEVRDRYTLHLRESQEALQTSIRDTIAAVEQAMVDGIIGDERADYMARIGAFDPMSTRDCLRRSESLRLERMALEAAREHRLQSLRDRWTRLDEDLRSPLFADSREQLTAMAEAALKNSDTRVLEELIARVRECVDTGTPLEAEIFEQKTGSRDVLQEFLDSVPVIEQCLQETGGLERIREAAERGRKKSGIDFGQLASPRRDEVSSALRAWRLLKQNPENPSQTLRGAVRILDYLGFESLRSAEGSLRRARDRMYVRMEAKPGVSTRPIPLYGSQSNGRYDVLCLWERPGIDTVASFLREQKLGTQPVLVFYLGRLTQRQRRDLVRMSRQQGLSLALLDETLLVFLAKEQDSRLESFLRVALSYSAAMPYTPFQAGDVPPEMFFGREEMARDLLNLSGTCVLYGGRQLGKSALLRHVQRQFHAPERGQYAWVENMKVIYDPLAGRDTDGIWPALRDAFKERDLIGSRVTTDRPQAIGVYLREALKDPHRQVLVLLDECDAFLDADQKQDFRTVTALRELMLETERRFRVVFAGLHNVQRFNSIPNQPLAHFGTPLCVGPLEPRAAMSLVREPFEALGYRFRDAASVLRILSYTNYHPGLIQLFCQELLKDMHRRTQSVYPPYWIEDEHVEAIYRQSDIRERIRERLDWTLALDRRYQVIAWSLVAAQMDERDSFAASFRAAEILDLVKHFWPKGFADVRTEQFRSILEEMNGLGVLVRAHSGEFSLRSPNLVRLLGSEESIEDQLLSMEAQEPEQSPDVDDFHAMVDKSSYSPLAYSQLRLLCSPTSGCALIFCSEAQGAASIPRVTEQLVSGPEEGRVYSEITAASIQTGVALRNWLDGRSPKEHTRHVVRVDVGPLAATQVLDLISTATDYCNALGRHRWMRFIFLFSEVASWRWLSLENDVRSSVEERVLCSMHPGHWNRVAIRRLLEQEELIGSEETVASVIAHTGGWHSLIADLLSHCRRGEEVRAEAQSIGDSLSGRTSSLRQSFASKLGLDVDPAVHGVAEELMQWHPQAVPMDLVMSERASLTHRIDIQTIRRIAIYLERMGCAEIRDSTVTLNEIVAQALLAEHA